MVTLHPYLMAKLFYKEGTGKERVKHDTYELWEREKEAEDNSHSRINKKETRKRRPLIRLSP